MRTRELPRVHSQTGRTILLLSAALLGVTCRPSPPPPPAAEVAPPPQLVEFEATAYSIEGITASGHPTRTGIVAADPAVLPLGTHIRLHEAGRYSGEYVVTDTGRGIKGREIDIYLPNDRQAKRFGRRRVHVERLESGPAAGSRR